MTFIILLYFILSGQAYYHRTMVCFQQNKSKSNLIIVHSELNATKTNKDPHQLNHINCTQYGERKQAQGLQRFRKS